MEKPVAAVEFSSKSLKIVIGYELEGKIYVLYALNKPYGHIIEAGNILDKTAILNKMVTFVVWMLHFLKWRGLWKYIAQVSHSLNLPAIRI